MELEDWEGNKTFAQYNYFKVGAYEDKYRLAVSGYSGAAGSYFLRICFKNIYRQKPLDYYNTCLKIILIIIIIMIIINLYFMRMTY